MEQNENAFSKTSFVEADHNSTGALCARRTSRSKLETIKEIVDNKENGMELLPISDKESLLLFLHDVICC